MPHHIHQQTFQYDALGNITSCTTQFVEGGQNTATYSYERSSGKDPCQLKSVAHTHADYPKQITLTYDAGGRLQADEHSRTLTYDACGRLASIAAGASLPAASYQYDAFDRLVEQTIGADTTSLYYRANALVNQLTGTDASQHQRFIGGGIAQSTNETVPKTWLTGSDSQRNVLLAEQGETRETQTYSLYGYREPDAKTHSKLGYTGERRDPASGVYHLGNGYRSYNPVLMRFTAPDSWSPFGAGGINPYAYCAGDPINRADPSGHLSGGSWINIGISVVTGTLGVALAIPTGGMSLSTAAAVEMGLGLAATDTGIASAVLEEKDPKASAVLGWVSLGLGVVSAVRGLGRSVVAAIDRNLYARGFRRVNGRFGLPLSGGDGLDVAGPSTSRAGTSFNEQRMSREQIMAHIADPKNFKHDIRKINDNYNIFSCSADGSGDSYFWNKYNEKEWRLIANGRNPKEPFFTSEMLEYQHKEIVKKYNLPFRPPERIVQESVVNEITLSETEGKVGDELMQSFLNRTPNGKLIQRIMETFNLQATHVERQNKDFTVHVVPI